MVFNFKRKKVLFKDFFPHPVALYEEQMELKHVVTQARLRAAGGGACPRRLSKS